jgi:glycosyltransferase involved in cell wall biosynthesis
MKELVSVIIPCYNYGAYIAETLDSLIAQSYQHWEAIVVDDGSTDESEFIVQKYMSNDNRIKYIKQQNKGVAVARNRGLSEAVGSYIQFLDADDYIAPDKFLLQVKKMDENPSIDLIYSDSYLFNHSNFNDEKRLFNKFNLKMPPISGKGELMAMQMVYDNIFLIGCPLFRRSVVSEREGFNTSILAFEDWVFWYKAVLNGFDFCYDNSPGTEFYVRAHGNNTTANRYKMWKYKIQARESIIRIIDDAVRQKKQGINFAKLLRKHQVLLYEERARFKLLYEGIGEGLADTWRYAMQGENTWHIWYDSAYWLKERLLGRNKISK